MSNRDQRSGLNINENGKLTLNRGESAHEPEKRPERVPLTGNLKTQFPLYKRDDKKYYYYVFVDYPDEGNIEQAKAAYYEQCFYDDGTPCIVRPKGLPHHLMRMPIEYKLQDELDRERERRATLGESNKIDTANGEYAPNGSNSAFTVDSLDPRL